MSAVGEERLADALLAARLCAVDPGLGGMILRGGGEARDLVLAELRTGLPGWASVKRMPVHIDDERLLGGIDLAATLARGAAVSRAGLLAEADGGAVIVPMAERLSDAMAGRLAAAIDGDARFVTVALDDGIEAEERSPAALMERLAFWIDLSHDRHSGHGPGAEVPQAAAPEESWTPDQIRDDGEVVTALVAIAVALGIDTARAPLFALRAARAAARLDGRAAIAEQDILLAARLVLAPRATRLPTAEEAPAEPPPPPPQDYAGEQEQGSPAALEDVVLAATLAALPKDVLARIAAGTARDRRATTAHGAGERRKSGARGRPMGARAGLPGGGRRLALIDTLRAAAPWQKLRGAAGRVAIRRDDLRIRRFETRAEAVTIFAVDASGSSALARLAEAKGAVELLLAEAYVKRAQVALIAFRGTTAELLLPPTRSLVRARRALAELPGGGGTPLAAGLRAAQQLAEAARARGRTPFLVVLTDGRANIAADGRAVRAAAVADAMAAAKAIGAGGVQAAFLDISARPGPEGAALATAMRARYLPLPRADAATMHAAVRAVQPR
ncbi:magnesium chelatase subunit D [Sphingomonas hylomeconis]|uniref:Magnesium chelatase subunit D n=1 Tax=Sphingomonas hylomeconis TaxID=1395958 RepID=A0ABV7SUC0_9SPHN|nr:magnesium chelatase subunit D [Sphingomonas hylomeconis]